MPSPSVWRARIETALLDINSQDIGVALRMEGEDRNITLSNNSTTHIVALRMEGEDRNPLANSGLANAKRRPPYGGRG